jgi:hypothetical protein
VPTSHIVRFAGVLLVCAVTLTPAGAQPVAAVAPADAVPVASAVPADPVPTGSPADPAPSPANPPPATDPSPAPSPVPPPPPTGAVKDVENDVTLTFHVPKGYSLDPELWYHAANRHTDAYVGGQGHVQQPVPQMVRPGMKKVGDGLYQLKFNTFLRKFSPTWPWQNREWLRARFQLYSVEIGVLTETARATSFQFRSDAGPDAPPVGALTRVSVRRLSHGNGGASLSVDLQTAQGSAPHALLSLPVENGKTELNVEVDVK